MPAIKQSQVIDKSVEKAFIDLNEALKITIQSLGLVVEESKELNTQFAGLKGLKGYSDALKKLNTTRKASEDLTKQQIELLKKEEQLKQSVARTTAAQEKAIQSKNRTAEQERKITERQTKELAKSTSAYAKLSKQLTTNRNKAKDLAVQIDQATVKYGKNSKQVQALERSYNKLATSVNKTDAQLKKIDSNLGQRQRNVGNYTQGVKNLVGAFGVVGGIQLFAKAIKSAFDISKKYEKKNAELASVLGKTTKETAALQKQSKTYGATTAFSATQVTELQTELARLGKTEEEIIASTKGIINATIALGSETGETAALVGATLNAFQLQASKSSHVADVLTLATQKSALSFDKLNTAIPIAAGAAAAAGVSFETMVAQLGQAADRGIDAGTAATSLRNIYISLADSGLTLEEALSQINNSQDKLSTATKLFGKRAAVTALALAGTTEKTAELTIALENAGGTAKRVAEQQLDTLDGQLKLLNSAWEGFVLNINNSDTALGKFAKETVGFATRALTGFANIGLLLKTVFGDIKDLSEIELEQLINSATLENGKNAATVLEDLVDTYGKLPDAAKEAITLNQFLFENLVAIGESMDDSRVIADYYTDSLNKQNEALSENTNATDENANSISDEVIAKEDLIEIQKELLLIAKQMPGTTEAEITARNINIKAIEKEIARLEALGEVKAPEKIKADIIKLDDYKGLDKEIEKLEEEELKRYLKKEEEKTKILEEAEQTRSDLQKDLANELGASISGITNAVFDNKITKLEDETEAIQAFYDDKLATEELDEEQRRAIEAERDKRLNEQAAKEREIEKKQFLFNQGVKLAEIATQTALGVATATAQAPATYGASLIYIPLIIGTGLAQAAVIAAQTIPQFDSGTTSLPELSEVGEKRPEFVGKNGKWELITTPTILGKEYKGYEVKSGAETANILDGITRGHIMQGVEENKTRNEQLMIDAAMAKLGLNNMNAANKIINAINKNAPQEKGIDKMKRIISKHAE